LMAMGVKAKMDSALTMAAIDTIVDDARAIPYQYLSV
jgi:hypothetical protein